MANVRWACPDCEIQTSYKGLCRKCTEYGDDGRPVKPVNRVRLNHTPTTHNPRRLSKTDFLNARRRNPTKKQLEALKEQINSHSKPVQLQHECGDGCDHEEDFHEVGEIVGEEE